MTRIGYMLPKAENLLRLANAKIVRSRKSRVEAKLDLPPLIERAYLVTNETGEVPFTDLTDEEIVEAKRDNG
jgi:hypothetical protein